jgi:integrase
MGTITARPRKDGSNAYLAQILIKRDGKIVHREARTFDREPAARAWIKKREKEAKTPEGLDAIRTERPTLVQAINRYVKESRKAMGKTKAQVLETIKSYDIADRPCEDITSADLFAFAQELGKTRQPQTVANYLSHLGAVYAIARPAWGFPLDETRMRDAMKVAGRMGVTSKSRARDRRPTLDELDTLMKFFQERQRRRPAAAPMMKIIAFAIFSTRRQEEIVRIRWCDFDEEHDRILVRDMKNPGNKIGNDIWCDLPAEAVDIIKSMPKRENEERIFPFTTDAISASFTRACQFLAIEDLHFHDLRHDGVSRLFELGWNIPHVAAVSGHRSWQSLKRYTHLRQRGDKYEDWKWPPIVSAPA